MANRPISYPEWPLSGPNVAQPSAELAGTGWAPGVAPDAQNFNWLLGDINAWVKFLDQQVNTGIPLSVARLINGGTWSFDATSGALAWSAAANLAFPSIPDSANNIPAGSVVLADGDIAYLTANLPTYSQGDTSTTSNQNEITNLNFVGNIATGDAVSGPGIPSNTTVLGVGANFVTLSNNVTSNHTGATYTFVPVGNLTVQVASNISVIPNVNTILIARRSGNDIYLGVNCIQMVLRDGEFKSLNGSGYFSVYEAPAGQNLSKGQLVYISSGSGDGGRTAGALYPLDTSAANQALRGVYAGVIISDVLSAATAEVLYSGFFLESSLTPGATYYADPTSPGGITATIPAGAGQKVVPVGYAVTSTHLLFTGTASAPTNNFPIFSDEPDQFGDGSTVAFTLTAMPQSDQALLVYINGLFVPISERSLSGQIVTFITAPAATAKIEFFFVLANQGYVTIQQEVPIDTGNHQDFNLSGQPLSRSAMQIYVDGVKIDQQDFTLTQGLTSSIHLSSPITLSQNIAVVYFQPFSQGGGGGGGVSGAVNLDGGFGLFAGLSAGTLQFKSLVAGANMSISDGGDHLILASTGGGGGGIEAHGSDTSPIALTPSVGLVPTSSLDQVWIVAPASGAVPITANPQIAAATQVGLRLTIMGISDSNYFIFNDGTGLKLNGPCNLTAGQALVVMWTGSVYREVSRVI